MRTLDLPLIGNGTIGALVDARATISWGCFPRFDGDPVFCALLKDSDDYGFFAVELADCARTEQHYLENTAILVTRLYDRNGGAVEVTDFAPRFGQYGRIFRPMMLVRRIRRLGGSPRLILRLRPACDDGAARPAVIPGSSHIRYVAPTLTLRLTTDASLTAIQQETAFFLEDTVTLLLGADETVHEAAGAHRRRHHQLHSRGGRQPPQLGLPLLLAARRLFRGQRPQPPGRDPHHGALSRLHREHCRQRRRRPHAASKADGGPKQTWEAGGK